MLCGVIATREAVWGGAGRCVEPGAWYLVPCADCLARGPMDCV